MSCYVMCIEINNILQLHWRMFTVDHVYELSLSYYNKHSYMDKLGQCVFSSNSSKSVHCMLVTSIYHFSSVKITFHSWIITKKKKLCTPLRWRQTKKKKLWCQKEGRAVRRDQQEDTCITQFTSYDSFCVIIKLFNSLNAQDENFFVFGSSSRCIFMHWIGVLNTHSNKTLFVNCLCKIEDWRVFVGSNELL